MTLRDQINEVLKQDKPNNNHYHHSEVVKMIYVLYKDIEKIKHHLGIK